MHPNYQIMQGGGEMKNLSKPWALISARIKRQKKTWLCWSVLLSCCLAVVVNPNFANDISSSFSATQLDIEPQIVVQANTPTIVVNDPVVTGDFEVTVDFSVESNTQNVNMFVEATDFYFYKDPTAQVVDPIRLVESAGVEIDPQGATAVNGHNASFTGVGDTIDGYPSRKTASLTFQSNSGDHVFSHPVAVTVIWELEPMKPAGSYSAKVRLTCIAIPPDG